MKRRGSRASRTLEILFAGSFAVAWTACGPEDRDAARGPGRIDRVDTAREPGGRRVERGSFYTLTLPPGTRRLTPSAPEVVEATYLISAVEGVSLAVFRPVPGAQDLEAWVRASEGALDGIAQRYDQGRVDGVEARITVLPGERRWTFVRGGLGFVVRCIASEPHDEAWMAERCDATVDTFRFVPPRTL